MKQSQRATLNHGTLSKTISHDSCLDRIEEAISYAELTRGENGRSKNSKRRSTTFSTTNSPNLLSDSYKQNPTGSKKFLSFFHKGFHGSKSKSMTRMDHQEFIRSAMDQINIDLLSNVIPIPIRETAIQSHSRTLFHKLAQSNVRAKPLLKLDKDTRFISIHSSLLANNFGYCVKIISRLPPDYRKCSSGNQLELSTASRSLGHGSSGAKLKDNCPSCHASNLCLLDTNDDPFHMIGYLFACSSDAERRKWLNVLTRVAKPSLQNERRRETSLNIWIQEAKNVTPKKKYFCEVYLDDTLHARTTTKTMTNMLFWGEEFQLSNLDEISNVTIVLWKAGQDSRKKKKSHHQLICQVSIATKDIDQRNTIEKWYSPCHCFNTGTIVPSFSSCGNHNMAPFLKSYDQGLPESIPHLNNSLTSSTPSSSGDPMPMLRIKACYQNFDVLPLDCYTSLIEFLRSNAVDLLLEMESYLKVKNKEDLAANLINIIHQQGIAVDFLCDLIIHEINVSDDPNMILRGNTMASKAIEVYLKLVGEKYLSLTLSDFVHRVLRGDDDCEVDPEKDKPDQYQHHSGSNNSFHSSSSHERLNGYYSLHQKQESLLMNVDMVWAKIMSSSIYFPRNLKLVFVALRRRLETFIGVWSSSRSVNEPDLCDRIISACIFLRYICPAILTPSLFGLIAEYPDNPKVTRTFTLVAKCIQTLANFSDLTGIKESYMVFMNGFIENNFATMRNFLKQISTPFDETDNKEKAFQAFKLDPSDSNNQNCLYWENLSNSLSEDTIDLCLCLAKLHRQLEDYLKLVPAQNVSHKMQLLHTILDQIKGKISAKASTSTQTGMKYSQSYQDINAINEMRPATNASHYTDNARMCATLTRPSDKWPRHYDGRNSRPSRLTANEDRTGLLKSMSSLCVGNESQTHLMRDLPPTPTTPYLMSQSMIEDDRSYASQSSTMTRDEVDKQWRDMLSQSDNYARPRQNLATSSIPNCDQPSAQMRQVRPDTNNRASVADMRHDDAPLGLSAQYQSIDTCSTETITSTNVRPMVPMMYPSVRPVTSSLNSSYSMPSFHVPDATVDFQSQLREGPSGDRSSQRGVATINDGQNPVLPSYNQVRDDLHGSKLKQMKQSLDKLHQNLNARITQLMLADASAIQLELDRVRLMKQIFAFPNWPELDGAPHNHRSSVSRNGTAGEHWITIHHHSGSSRRLTLKKYLEFAEGVLLDVQLHQSKGDPQRQAEYVLMQILDRNQWLQNIISSKNDGPMSNGDLQARNLKPSAKTNQKIKGQSNETPQFKMILANKSDPSLLKKHSSNGSLMSSASSNTLIELIDAV